MISVEKATEIILQSTQNFGVESISFLESEGRILKETIVADRDFPPFNRVMMDGIAINFSCFKNSQLDFKIEAIQAAGSSQLTLQNNQNCMEVMTGAMLPKNTDTVIRYEDLSIENGVATVTISGINAQQNIHFQGKDKKEGAVLIEKNIIISAAEIGIFATVGKAFVSVAKHPKTLLISTGDELVNVDENPLVHQIRKSNVYTLASLLKRLKIQSEIAHIPDDKNTLKTKIARYLKEFDVLLFSGAVSKGKFDYLPEVLEELGVEKLFHRVQQRPGKPFWFGRYTATETKKTGATIFAFPGNPISTFVNCLVYFYPWFYTSVDVFQKTETAKLTENVTFKPSLTYFLQVKLTSENGQLFATPITGNGSGDLASLSNSDGFITLPKNITEFKKGAIFPVIQFR